MQTLVIKAVTILFLSSKIISSVIKITKNRVISN